MKKRAGVLLAIILCFSVCAACLAETEEPLLSEQKNELQGDLDILQKKYPGSTMEVSIERDVVVEDELVFENIEEYEQFLESFYVPTVKGTAELYTEASVDMEQREGTTKMVTLQVNMNALQKGCVAYVDLKYVYDYINFNPYFVDIKDAVSYIGGVTSFDWTQTMYDYSLSKNFVQDDTLDMTVKGYITLTASVGGIPVNTTLPQTWDFFYRA